MALACRPFRADVDHRPCSTRFSSDPLVPIELLQAKVKRELMMGRKFKSLWFSTVMTIGLVAMGCQDLFQSGQNSQTSGARNGAGSGAASATVKPGATPSSPSSSGTATTGAPTPIAGFLTMSDLANPGNLYSDTEAELTANINGESGFYYKSPNTPTTGCMGQVFGSHQVQADGQGNLVVNFTEPNLAACMNADPDMAYSGGTWTAYSLRVLAVFQCPGVDLSKYNGMTMAAFEAAQVSPFPCTVGLANTQTVSTAKTPEFTHNISTVDATIGANQVAASPGGVVPSVAVPAALGGSTVNVHLGVVGGATACVARFANATLTSDSCQHIKVTKNSVSGAYTATNYYRQTSDHNVATKAATSPFYESGTMSFVSNKWSGTMTYTGANAAPTWTAMDAMGNQARGTFLSGGSASSPSATAGTTTAGAAATALNLTDSSVGGPSHFIWLVPALKDVSRMVHR